MQDTEKRSLEGKFSEKVEFQADLIPYGVLSQLQFCYPYYQKSRGLYEQRPTTGWAVYAPGGPSDMIFMKPGYGYWISAITF